MKAKTRKGSVIKSLIGIVLLLALSYVLSGLFLTLEDLLHMVGQNKASRNTELGEARYEELKASGIPESASITFIRSTSGCSDRIRRIPSTRFSHTATTVSGNLNLI